MGLYMISVIGCGFPSLRSNTKDHKNGTNCHPVWHTDIKGRAVFGTFYGDMHYKDNLKSIVYLFLHLSNATWPDTKIYFIE